MSNILLWMGLGECGDCALEVSQENGVIRANGMAGGNLLFLGEVVGVGKRRGTCYVVFGMG